MLTKQCSLIGGLGTECGLFVLLDILAGILQPPFYYGRKAPRYDILHHQCICNVNIKVPLSAFPHFKENCCIL